MKGLSTILAMILIVIITVALIGLTYTFASGLIVSSGTAAVSTTINMTTNLQKSIYINSASCPNNGTGKAVQTNVTFTLKATGSNPISGTAHELGAALDGGDITPGTYEYGPLTNLISNSNINAGSVKTYVFQYLNSTPTTYITHTLIVSAPAGDVSYTITNCLK